MVKLKHKFLLQQRVFINGKWQDSTSKNYHAIVNPATLKKISQVPACTAQETKTAVQAAHQAYLDYRTTTAAERAELLQRWAELIDQYQEDLALLITQEQGKPLSEALGEIKYANSFIKWFAAEAKRIYGDIIPAPQPKQHLLVIKQAIGVVAAITPWNFPAAMITRKIAPALAAGCSVVIKPAEETPLTALALVKLAELAGMPAGVINIITGNAKTIGKVLTHHPLVRKLSFTGSTAVGKLLMQQCASTLKKLSLELGGNAPFIVFADADIDAAVAGLITAKFRNSGQTCVCANRIYVQRSIYEEFTVKLLEAMQKLTVGDGLKTGIDQGPLINAAAVKKVRQHIADAVKKGGKIKLGGKPHALGGYFFQPTLITHAKANMLLAKEETFGPLAALFIFDSDTEVIAAANDTPFGLAAYFYSNDISRIWQVATALETGMVGINCGLVSNEVAPFGGIKQSGMEREGSKYGIEPYIDMKYICLQTS